MAKKNIQKPKYVSGAESAEFAYLKDLYAIIWLLRDIKFDEDSAFSFSQDGSVFVNEDVMELFGNQLKEKFQTKKEAFEMFRQEVLGFEKNFKQNGLISKNPGKIMFDENEVHPNSLRSLKGYQLSYLTKDLPELVPNKNFGAYKKALVKCVKDTFSQVETMIKLKNEIFDHLNKKIEQVDAKSAHYKESYSKREAGFNKKFPVIVDKEGKIVITPSERFRAEVLTPQKNTVVQGYANKRVALSEQIATLPANDNDLQNQLKTLKASPNKKQIAKNLEANKKAGSDFYKGAEHDLNVLLKYLDNNADKRDPVTKNYISKVKEMQSLLKWSKDNVSYTADFKANFVKVFIGELLYDNTKGLFVKNRTNAMAFFEKFQKESVFAGPKVEQPVVPVQQDDSNEVAVYQCEDGTYQLEDGTKCLQDGTPVVQTQVELEVRAQREAVVQNEGSGVQPVIVALEQPPVAVVDPAVGVGAPPPPPPPPVAPAPKGGAQGSGNLLDQLLKNNIFSKQDPIDIDHSINKGDSAIPEFK